MILSGYATVPNDLSFVVLKLKRTRSSFQLLERREKIARSTENNFQFLLRTRYMGRMKSRALSMATQEA